MNLYRDIILDHYKHPRNFGKLENPDAVGREANAACGDLIEFQLTVNNSQLTSAKWRGIGCAVSTASASLLSEKVLKIRRISQISKIAEKDLIKMLGGKITSARTKCAVLPLFALQKAIEKLSDCRITGMNVYNTNGLYN